MILDLKSERSPETLLEKKSSELRIIKVCSFFFRKNNDKVFDHIFFYFVIKHCTSSYFYSSGNKRRKRRGEYMHLISLDNNLLSQFLKFTEFPPTVLYEPKYQE